MNCLFLMDPLETVNVRKDTTWMLMTGAVRRGHTAWYLPLDGISLDRGVVKFHACRAIPKDAGRPPFETGDFQTLSADQVDVVFVRPDPPFDDRYLMHTWLLDHLPPRVQVINSPRGLRTVNEKLWSARFTDLVPDTLVTGRRELFDAFLAEHGRVVAKPTDGFGGKGVFVLRAGDSNASVIFETLVEGGRRKAILQSFVAEAEKGDKRVLLLDGEPLGAVLRVSDGKDHRNNFFAGGKPVKAQVSDADRRIVATLAPHLKELGLRFVGIDVIGDKLIEVNVTSPTCMQEINRLDGVQLEELVIERVEQAATAGATA